MQAVLNCLSVQCKVTVITLAKVSFGGPHRDAPVNLIGDCGDITLPASFPARVPDYWYDHWARGFMTHIRLEHGFAAQLVHKHDPDHVGALGMA